ncbi:MAG: gliding motility-associated C-terminal domain-containing protein, partial [Bacteroidales bacterium]|nr:gliding motility-associated C-terminal domain-containing protein [Bacteroidales bacterium]
ILTYTFAPSPADRPELLIEWGDGADDILPRVEATDLPNDIRRNVYKGQHTYSAPAVYIISLEDPNRNYGIINIPNSVNVPLYIQTVLVINPFLGANNSPALSLPPIDNGCVGIPYIHNPGAYDIDGDSLSYRLVDCKGAGGLNIPGYTLPPASTSFSLDPITGDLYWDAPTMQGEFNVAILIEEWRNGVFIGSVTRDMQIIIAACNQQPPVIAPLKDTCVEAGDYLAFTVSATDPNGHLIYLTGSGAPMQLSVSPARFDSIYGQGEVYQTFTWQTECDHVKRMPYTLYFKAKDNGQPVSLVDIETMRVTVVGPAPENLSATPLGSGINLDWDISPCPNADGYEIYRRVDSSGWMHGYCETGVPAYTGFQRIATLDHIDSTSYRDDNDGRGLTHGLDYCYVVVATYPDGALSYASNEACATLKRDVPI